MRKRYEYIEDFFKSKNSFSSKEWILKQQIHSMLILSFFFGIGVFFFSIFRLWEENYIVGISQFIFSSGSIYGFFRLRQDKNLYSFYALTFFLMFFIYTGIIFFFVPENHLNILWVISAPILIFFFLDRKGGTVMFLLVFSFILYLIISDYHYSIAEFITLLASFFMTSFVMYMYENIKDAETKRLLIYNKKLQQEVEEKTKTLTRLNETLEKRVQEEINKRHAQEQMLLCQNRMANMGMMIDSIAHQWRQPLMNINAILMNISRITETEPNNIEYVDNKVDTIFQITEHMSQTINDFRNLFQPEKRKESFKVEKLIKNILTLIKGLLTDIKIIVEIEKEITLESYQNELSQVIIIILYNAIEVLESRKINNKQITLKLYQNEKNIYFEIEDNAKGIKEKNLKKIFEPYFSTKKENAGTGLGLYIAKIIVEHSLKGKISVCNIRDGASFQLSIPKLL